MAADDAVAVTRRIGEAQTRAYLSVSNFVSTVTDDCISVKVTFTNTGQTPARNVRFHIAWASDPPPFRDEWHPVTIVEPEGAGSVGAGMPFFGSVRTDKFKGDSEKSLTHAQIGQVVSGEAIFWVFGVIEYNDVFAREVRRTRFRYMMNLDTHANNIGFSPCKAGNEET